MNLNEFFLSLSSVSLRTLSLAARRPAQVRNYVGYCLKRYDELAGDGLPCLGPVVPSAHDTITLPAIHTGGGMSFAELVILARVTKTRKPKTVFEMGSYDGLTTAVFILNAPTNAQIYSLDLPEERHVDELSLDSDKELVEHRKLGAVPRAIGLNHYVQLFCDTMYFDPSPYANSIDLGLVDAAHDAEHVRNDTIKMARMMSPDGLVFWHDYGGKGAMRPLARYLESIGRRCALYRIPETTLAWAHACDLKQASL